jgi:hypothetical protein
MVVHLGREVVRLGLADATDERGLFMRVMQVQRQRVLVVEELADDRPGAVPGPQALADEVGAEMADQLVERQPFCIWRDYKTERFVRTSQRAVVGAHG